MASYKCTTTVGVGGYCRYPDLGWEGVSVNWLDQLTRITAETLARKINRRDALKRTAGIVFGTLVSLTLFDTTAEAAPCDHCQTWQTNYCDCSPPRGTYCQGCGSSAGSCPTDYKISYAWGYGTTGCWCVSCSPGAPTYKVCCDCTHKDNDPRTRHDSDCGCSWTYSPSGYCVSSTPLASY